MPPSGGNNTSVTVLSESTQTVTSWVISRTHNFMFKSHIREHKPYLNLQSAYDDINRPHLDQVLLTTWSSTLFAHVQGVKRLYRKVTAESPSQT